MHPTHQGEAFTAARTLPTAEVAPEAFEDVLIVHGAFGLSGAYPLAVSESGEVVRHCNMYFVRISASEATRERSPVVVERTSYLLRYRGQSYENEAQCEVCLNGRCPANRNARALEREWAPGTLVLAP